MKLIFKSFFNKIYEYNKNNRKFLFSFILLILFLFISIKNVFADWNGQPFLPGSTDNPPCLPSEVNCDVVQSLTTEVDPVFMASSAFAISGTDIAKWNSSYGWGNHANAGYLTGIKVDSFNNRTGAVSLTSLDVTNALAFTPYNATNPAGYISSYTETDPTVYSWAKATTKPSYTASEVGLGNVPNLSFSGSNTGDETTLTIKTKLGTASTSADGYLTSTDWNIFNNKQPAGSYLTSYTETDPIWNANKANYSTTSQANLLYKPIGYSPDLSGYSTKTVADTLYLGIGATASNSSLLENHNASYFQTALGYTPYNATNPAGYISSYTETDPTVYSWAKATTKPSYTASEVGGRSSSYFQQWSYS